MPQDKRKSISYRSFVTCDNPKGVVECGSIRKSKINSQKRGQFQQQSFKVDLGDIKVGNPITTNASLGVIKEDKKKMCIEKITREELDVSKGGEKMNHVINSLSKGKGSSHQDEIAKGLLRGAIDLQDSIVMLGKLQEEAFSSLNMSRSKRKGRSKFEEGTDCMVNGVTTEEVKMGFERPRKSTDEMKNVVRDSLLRQNMITNPIFEEHFDHRMMGFSDMPSTSSSQSSSRVRSSNFVPSDSSSSSTISQRRKKKDPNLIVRLMGLESPPLSPRWRIEGEKIVNLPRKGGQYGAHVLGKKQRSVEEILESLHFKGLLRSSSMNGRTPNAVESEVFSLENGFPDQRPPIVIMKPICNPHRDQEQSIIPKFWLEGITKPSQNHEIFSHFTEQGKNSLKKDPKPRTKNEALRKSVEVEKVSPSRRKEVYKDVRFHDKEKSANAQQRIKQKDGRLISKQQNFTSNSNFHHRKQEICEILGQPRKNRQSAFVEEKKKGKGKVKEKDIEVVYRKDASNCDSNNVLPVVKSVILDGFIEQNQPRNKIRDYNVEASIEHRLNSKTPIYDITLADTHGYDDSNSCYSEITSVSTSDHYSPACEVTLVTTHENGIPVNNLCNKSPSLPCKKEPEVSQEKHHETPPKTRLQTLLLSNPSFLSNLKELLDITVFPVSAPYDVGKDRVLIDYVNEVLDLKKLEISPPYLPQTWIHPKKAPHFPSLDQLLEEVGNNIEGMKQYHGSSRDDKFSSDKLYQILDRDLKFKSGLWEIGWKRMFTRDEFELVVRDVGNVLLGKLIEEAVLEFMVV